MGRVAADPGRPVAGAGLVRQCSPRPASGGAHQPGTPDACASGLGPLTQGPETDQRICRTIAARPSCRTRLPRPPAPQPAAAGCTQLALGRPALSVQSSSRQPVTGCPAELRRRRRVHTAERYCPGQQHSGYRHTGTRLRTTWHASAGGALSADLGALPGGTATTHAGYVRHTVP
ncbi:hypothetical protein D3C80_1109640 [compost metagenome]